MEKSRDSRFVAIPQLVRTESGVKRGEILLPRYGRDKMSREKYWSSLTDAENTQHVRLPQPSNGNKQNGNASKELLFPDCSPSTFGKEDRAPEKKISENVGTAEEAEKKLLLEMTQHLNELLRIGQTPPSAPTIKSGITKDRPVSCNSRLRACEVAETCEKSPPKAERRVPFTARSPKPPPFLPSFSDDEEEASSTKTAQQSSPAIIESTTVKYNNTDAAMMPLKRVHRSNDKRRPKTAIAMQFACDKLV